MPVSSEAPDDSTANPQALRRRARQIRSQAGIAGVETRATLLEIARSLEQRADQITCALLAAGLGMDDREPSPVD